MERIELRKCSCGSEDLPVIYREGLATQYLEYPEFGGKLGPLNWASCDGFVVECTECGAITRHYIDADRAIQDWNNMRLEYQGDSCV